jgi:anthranilate/para-aminobenzoate synthase component II
MFFGAKLVHAPYPMHGKQSIVKHTEHPLFNDVPTSFEVMRYHSLVIENLESTGLKTIASATDDNTIMAITHDTFPCTGIQFHPESIGTAHGLQLLTNWAKMHG